MTPQVVAEINGNYDGMQLIRETNTVKFYWDVFNKKYEQGRILVERGFGMKEWECDFFENKKKQQEGYLILEHVPTQDAGLEATLLKEGRVYMSKETKQSLRSYMKALEEKQGKKVQLQIVDEHSFPISPGLTLCCMNESAALFSYQSLDGKQTTFSICDVGIAKWIYRFLNFLPDSGWVYLIESDEK